MGAYAKPFGCGGTGIVQEAAVETSIGGGAALQNRVLPFTGMTSDLLVIRYFQLRWATKGITVATPQELAVEMKLSQVGRQQESPVLLRVSPSKRHEHINNIHSKRDVSLLTDVHVRRPSFQASH